MIIGLDAIAAYSCIIRSLPQVSLIRVFEYESPPLAQTRFANTTAEGQIVNNALEIRKRLNMPFWDALLLSCFSAEEIPYSILNAASLHVSHRIQERELSRDEIIEGRLVNMHIAPDACLAVSSEVRTTDNSTAHLPLIDFHLPRSDANQGIAIHVCKQLLPEGFVLLDSGRSYHVWGTALVGSKQMADLLARALLFSPIIDRAYVAHQLIEGRSALRLSSYRAKPSPTVIFSTLT